MSDQTGSTGFGHALEEIQKQLDEQARTIYSPTAIEHAHHPRNWGRMNRAGAHKIWQGPCGDIMEMYLRLDEAGTDGAVIREISFWTDGCGPSVACGSMLTTMVQGKPLAKACSVAPRDLLIALGGLPEETTHCAFLAVHTLQEAIDDWYRGAHKHSNEADDG